MEAMGIIFSNIYDSKMGDLTWERTSGSIPFGGRYRQIDFVLSNMSNSGIRNIGIITKYNYQSLMDHLANCEDWDLHLGENVRFLPPYATGHTGAYRGKLEALQTALPVLERSDTEYVILSDTTVLCAIDFSKVVDAHVASGCDLTVVAKAGKADGKHTQTLAVKVDENGKVEQARLSLGAVGGTPIRVTDAEEYMRGRVVDEKLVEEITPMVAETIHNNCRPANRLYKTEAARGLTADTFAKLMSRL